MLSRAILFKTRCQITLSRLNRLDSRSWSRCSKPNVGQSWFLLWAVRMNLEHGHSQILELADNLPHHLVHEDLLYLTKMIDAYIQIFHLKKMGCSDKF